MEGHGCPMMRVRNIENKDKLFSDSLFHKAVRNTDCRDGHCNGSIMNPEYLTDLGQMKPRAEVLTQAEEFCREFYRHLKMEDSGSHLQRWDEVRASIEETGRYELTVDELRFGAKTAWRNAPRCIGRRYWSRLELFDGRGCSTAKEMFELLCRHIEFATDGGNIRSAITVFPQRTEGGREFRVWNSQLISYAGHKQEDGSVLGDPVNVEFTRLCERLGYRFQKTAYDVLPLVLQANGEDPEVFQIPTRLVHEVHIRHPKHNVFEKMGVKWYALPAVANMLFDCGGLQFPGAPFNGWYMTTEIAVRDFCDSSRLDLLPKLAQGMGFDTSEAPAMWKDRALAEVHYAVVHSFKRERTTIVDHYTATETFMEHFQAEHRDRGGCPADWVWLVPPMSGSLCPVFHQEMISYKLRPSYDYQAPAWKTHKWRTEDPTRPQVAKRFSFRAVAKAVRLCQDWARRLMRSRPKCTVVFATETGKAAKFADVLAGAFSKLFEVRALGADDFAPVSRLADEQLVLFVASTFGNGEPPGNAERFHVQLEELRAAAKKQRGSSSAPAPLDDFSDRNNNSAMTGGTPLRGVKFGVFALGSRLYPHFCAFGHQLDTALHEMGAKRCIECGEGDELKGQEQSFREWTQRAFQAAANEFFPSMAVEAPTAVELTAEEGPWTAEGTRCEAAPEAEEPTVESAVSGISREGVFGARLRYRKQLQAFNSDRKTLLVCIDRAHLQEELAFEPGDHLAIFPPNPGADVEAVLEWLDDPEVDPDTVLTLHKLVGHEWRPSRRLPPCSLRTAVTRLLDLCAAPQQSLLAGLAQFATKPAERRLLELLGKDVDNYEAWRLRHAPNMAFLARAFPSARPTVAFLLDCLPTVKPRYYSISSSPNRHRMDVHLTVAVVEYQSIDGVTHRGMCTAWLDSVKVDEVIPCYIRKAPAFRLPADKRLPVVMVGPGTGVAPFRSFWQERDFQRSSHRLSNAGPMTLFFGCRSKTLDHIYERDVKRLLDNGTLTDYQLALSRESGQHKTYVQDLMWKEHHKLHRQLTEEGGHFYVCGDVRMADDVKEMLLTIFEDFGGMTRSEAEDFLAGMKKSNRFHEDIFGATSTAEKRTESERKKLRRRSAPPAQLKRDARRLAAMNNL